jgi:hypothetical protein
MTVMVFLAIVKEQRDATERRVTALQEQIDKAKIYFSVLSPELLQAQQELAEWNIVLARAQSVVDLPRATTESIGVKPHHKVKVRANSLAGQAAKILLEKGSMRLGDLVDLLAAQLSLTEKYDKFKTNVHTAIWRQKEDLFWKTSHGISLQTHDVEFVGDDQ